MDYIKEIIQIDTLILSLNECYTSDKSVALLNELERKRFTLEEQGVLEIHKNKIFIQNHNNKTQYRTRLNGKDMTATTYEVLIDKLFKIYYPYGLKPTFSSLYAEWHDKYEKKVTQGHKSIGSLKRHEFYYNKYLKDNRLSQMDVSKLKQSDIYEYFEEITANQGITRKELNNLKTLLNALYDLAIIKNISICPIRNISTRELKCKEPVKHGQNFYTDEDRDKILTACLTEHNKPYARAIMLQFYLGCRIGEIKALKWDDIDLDKMSVYIHTSVRMGIKRDEYGNPVRDANNNLIEEEYLSNTTKNGLECGNRLLKAKFEDTLRNELNLQRLENPNSPFVFYYNGHFLLTDVYNNILKRLCKKCCIPYHSSHAIRFWTATHLLKNGESINTVQRILGHSTPQMTQHYDKSIYDKSCVSVNI